MVDKKTFYDAVENIRVCYGNRMFLSNDNEFLAWYKLFKDCNESSFAEAIERCIKECRRTPVVADIMIPYKEIEDRRKNDAKTFLDLWEQICGLFPGALTKYRDDAECVAKMKQLTLDKVDGNYRKAMPYARLVWQKAYDYAEKNDAYFNNVDFKDYFMGVRE